MQGCCSLYGLGVRFNRPLGGLRGLAPSTRADVTVALGDLPPGLADDDAGTRELYVGDAPLGHWAPAVRFSTLKGGSFYRFAYADGTRIVVDRAGANVWASVPHGATDEDTGTYLLGPTLGFVLRLRGVVCLHASAVEIDGVAVAFAGAAGAGKSSIAAAFAQRGHRVLTDDVAPLVSRDDEIRILPAYPRIRLWPDSAAALFGSHDALPRITPTWDKRYLALDDQRRFAKEPLPLAAVYILSRTRRAGAHSIRRLDRKAGLIALVKEAYSARLLDAPMRAREFDFLSGVVGIVPVARLAAPDDFDRLPEVCDAVVRAMAR